MFKSPLKSAITTLISAKRLVRSVNNDIKYNYKKTEELKDQKLNKMVKQLEKDLNGIILHIEDLERKRRRNESSKSDNKRS